MAPAKRLMTPHNGAYCSNQENRRLCLEYDKNGTKYAMHLETSRMHKVPKP